MFVYLRFYFTLFFLRVDFSSATRAEVVDEEEEEEEKTFVRLKRLTVHVVREK